MTHGKGKVMFASMLGRSAFDRAENIKTLYDAYQGEKTAMLYRDPAFPNEIMNGEAEADSGEDDTIDPREVFKMLNAEVGENKKCP